MPLWVFPTHVGVYRKANLIFLHISRIPHACGGVPEKEMGTVKITEYSPRMWGCTEEAAKAKIREEYSPRMWGCTVNTKEYNLLR